MEKTYIFGHRNPDTDSVCTTIAYANYLKDSGQNVEAAVLGKLNRETEYVMNYGDEKIDTPILLEEVEDGQSVIMIDHNEFNQSVSNIENANIVEVIDHHRVDNFFTKQPLKMNLQPVGCTATIVTEIISENGTKNLSNVLSSLNARLLLSAIISDTLLFKSPTCTTKDEEVAEKLAEVAQVDIEEYGMNMLKAGTNLDDVSAEELIEIDSKNFDTSYGKVKVCQINTVCIDDILKNEKDIIAAIEDKMKVDGIVQTICMITDILNQDSMCIIVGEENKFEESFNVEVVENKAMLRGVLSRKKQIVPFLN